MGLLDELINSRLQKAQQDINRNAMLARPPSGPPMDTKGFKDPTDPSFRGWLNYLASLPEQADAVAEANFPNSARDSSVKNGFRHALGTGLLAQNLGASEGGLQGLLAGPLAKGVGYIWEGLSGADNLTKHGKITDTLHDLNANAIGATQAYNSQTPEQLASLLRQKALLSKQTRPPEIFDRSPGYLTHTVP